MGGPKSGVDWEKKVGVKNREVGGKARTMSEKNP